jgi:hypothetical protein
MQSVGFVFLVDQRYRCDVGGLVLRVYRVFNTHCAVWNGDGGAPADGIIQCVLVCMLSLVVVLGLADFAAVAVVRLLSLLVGCCHECMCRMMLVLLLMLLLLSVVGFRDVRFAFAQ